MAEPTRADAEPIYADAEPARADAEPTRGSAEPVSTVAWTRTTVTASDGVALAVFQAGDPAAPTLLLVHGYPDDHHVWDAVAGELVGRFHVVAFDVRGAGASEMPTTRPAYRLDQLAYDVASVAAHTAPEPVHLVGHDWGSVQSWWAVCAPTAPSRFASFTSISGPDARQYGAWLKRAWRDDRRRAWAQLRSSWYAGLFLAPILPELLWRSGLGHRLIGRTAPSRSVPDAVHGLELYRANLRPRRSARPRPCPIPVQVLAPRRDPYITVALQTEAPRNWVPDLRIREIDGGHWTMVRHPERVVGPLTDFVDGR